LDTHSSEGKLVGPRREIAPEEADRDPLQDLKKQLSEEFRDQPEERIDQAARHSLDRPADVKVRDFVGLFAWRHAPEPSFLTVFTSPPLSGPTRIAGGG
jgi:hypothetical protein